MIFGGYRPGFREGEKTITEIASEFSVHPNQIRQWRAQLLERIPEMFSQRKSQNEKSQDELVAELFRQIGQLKVELDWLKKSRNSSCRKKQTLVEPESPSMPIVRQCELLDLPRSSFYYEPAGESELNLLLMRMIDEEFMRHPFYGVRRMKAWLWTQGYEVNRKRVSRLMRMMGLMAIYPKPRLSFNGSEHQVYPNLLKGVSIDAPDMAWCTDITYIRLAHGFVYLVAVMDWNSRYVLSWELSTTLDTGFCLDAVRQALQISKPKIFNTDQGSQFTSTDFTGLLEKHDIKVSMGGRGRVFDNIFIERLWRSVKYEEVYLHDYATIAEARAHLAAYFHFYNEERLYETLGYRTPHEVYFGTSASLVPAEAMG